LGISSSEPMLHPAALHE